MGSFNHKRNLSNLPIEYGDKVVCMIGLRHNDSSDTFSPGFSFTPIALPIHGEYDDYGGVQNVVKTPGVEYLEKFSGCLPRMSLKLPRDVRVVVRIR